MRARTARNFAVSPRPIQARRRCLLIAASAVCVGLMLPVRPALATSDQTATRAYIEADYQLVHTGTSQMRRVRSTLRALRDSVARECPKAAAGSPQDPESTQLSDEVIGAMVSTVVARFERAG